MTLIYNTFQSPASGTTLTTGNTSNADGSSPFSNIVIAATGTLATDSTHPAFGPQGLKVATGTTAGLVYAEWLSVGPFASSSTQVWGCHYLYLTANPSATWRVSSMLGATNGFVGALAINSSGKLLGQDVSNATQTPTFTNACPLNQLFRVEWFTIASATAGQVEVKLFSNAFSTVATETQTSLATINTGTGVIAQGRTGQLNSAASTGPFWQGFVAFSDTGYVGPSNLAYDLPSIRQPVGRVAPMRAASY